MNEPTAVPETRDRFEWLKPEQTIELARRIIEAGPEASLERRDSPHGSCYRVHSAAPALSAALPDVNDSLWCPPWCR